jgi:hypothetical protein
VRKIALNESGSMWKETVVYYHKLLGKPHKTSARIISLQGQNLTLKSPEDKMIVISQHISSETEESDDTPPPPGPES